LSSKEERALMRGEKEVGVEGAKRVEELGLRDGEGELGKRA
jgi:hypothetical protein